MKLTKEPREKKGKKVRHQHKLFPHYNLGLFICLTCGKMVSL